jgi:hypothetical protein
VAILLTPTAAAANPMFTHAIDFGFATATKFAKNDAIWSAGLNTLFSYDRPGPNLQIGGNYDHISQGSIDNWGIHGDLFWRERFGTAGVSAGYGSVNDGTTSETFTSYGAFGEWYPLNSLTLRAKGGAFDGDITGWYGGAGVKYYASPYIALSVSYNYTRPSGDRLHAIDVDAEYLISRHYPLTIAVGYEHTQSRTTGTDALTARLKYRFGVAGSLVRLDRLGPTSWNGLAPLR